MKCFSEIRGAQEDFLVPQNSKDIPNVYKFITDPLVKTTKQFLRDYKFRGEGESTGGNF